MVQSVWPILVTAPFASDEAGTAKRQKFLDDVAYRIEWCSGIQCGMSIDGVEQEVSQCYGVIQFHPYQSTSPVAPPQLYDLLQRHLDFFPAYIEGQCNPNGFLELSEDPKRKRVFPEGPPPYTGKWKEEFPHLQWEDDRLAFIADDTTFYDDTDEVDGQNVPKMSIVAIYVDMHALTETELHEDFKSLNGANVFAGSLLGRSPEWCKARAIEAYRTSAGQVSLDIANVTSGGNLFFYEVAESSDVPRRYD